jgi:hypothetical protein
MTMLSDINNLAGGSTPTDGTFKFKRVGDTVKGKVLRSSLVETTDRKTNRTKTALVVDIEVAAAKGGIVTKIDEDGIEQIKVSDFATGSTATVWLNQGFGIGAIRDALLESNASELRDGGTLAIRLTEKRDTGKESPANVFAAKYEPPVGGTSVDDLDDSF